MIFFEKVHVLKNFSDAYKNKIFDCKFINRKWNITCSFAVKKKKFCENILQIIFILFHCVFLFIKIFV